MLIAFYISGHGFGHAARVTTVINELSGSHPDIEVLIRTSAPRWFLERSLVRPARIETVETDTGVAQITSLALDVTETARRAAAFYGTFDARVSAECRQLRDAGVSMVVGDVPPLAFAAAARAGIPSAALANFTWDWIYERYEPLARLAPDVLPVIRRAYADASVALRLPFHGGFQTMKVVRDVPLVARRSALGRKAARERLGLPSDATIVLASFGGHGAQIDLQRVARLNTFTLVATDYEGAPAAVSSPPTLRSLTTPALGAMGIRYEDLVAAADVVVSKPGYGIVSECVANGTALLYTSRGSFAEQEVLIDGMQRVLRCRFIDQDALMAGRWQEAVDTLLKQPSPSETLEINGAEAVAQMIAEFAR